ncbi:MAG TPA: 4-hydroxy-2-oxoheptanedioate aldolase [Burkholderiaceae bacterium]|jgi:4-hydroxy-2-oxoheptanedioate aldolase
MSTDNVFKAALQAGRTQIGLWLSLADPYATEVCASTGFDWMLIDGEHSPNDLRSVLGALQAAAPYPTHAVVRPPIGETWMIKQYLDIGAQTLLIPMVETVEQAEQLVAAVRYPPQGIRGVGSRMARASQFGAQTNYLQRANDRVCLLVQIESVEGLANLEAIARVDGIDGVFIGPSDLSAALGFLGNPAHPEVQAAIAGALKRIASAGKPSGILTLNPDEAQHYLELGACFVAVGADMALLAQAARALSARFAGARGRAA